MRTQEVHLINELVVDLRRLEGEVVEFTKKPVASLVW